ncbi:MAG TPA: preprotein translocase subunit YajC [Marmoricola sp.]
MPGYAQLLVIIAALAVFWLLVMAPARRQQKNVAHLQEEIVPGDPVVISAGIYGTVRTVEGSKVTLEVAPGVVLTVARQVVVRRQPTDEQPAAGGDRPETPPEGGPGTTIDTPSDQD